MSGDYFPNRYFPDGYFPGRYFQGGEQAAGAISASLSGSGSITASIVGVRVASDDARSKGGWDPHYYKRRNKQRTKRKDVERFVQEIAHPGLGQAPSAVQKQAQGALDAARAALKLDELSATQKALSEINEFYAIVRAEAKRLRDEEDESEIELLLLAA